MHQGCYVDSTNDPQLGGVEQEGTDMLPEECAQICASNKMLYSGVRLVSEVSLVHESGSQ